MECIPWPNKASRILCYYFLKRQKPKSSGYSVSFPHRMKVGYLLYSEGFFTCIIPVPPNRIPGRSDEVSLKRRYVTLV